MEKKVWLITGVSKGLGLALAKTVISNGDIVVGTVRKEEDKNRFQNDVGGDAFILDLKELDKIDNLVEYVLDKYNRIDVLVNCAGYGAFGMLEEFTIEEVREQMDVNFLAVWKLCQAVLPHLRSQRSGIIVQISSRLGISSGVARGVYSAAKFAVEGLSEALREELKPFNVKVYLVEPGALRTDFFGNSIAFAKNEIEGYKEVLGSQREIYKSFDGKQPGDPIRAAELIVRLLNQNSNSFRIPLTQGTLDTIKDKVTEYNSILGDFDQLAKSVEFKNS